MLRVVQESILLFTTRMLYRMLSWELRYADDLERDSQFSALPDSPIRANELIIENARLLSREVSRVGVAEMVPDWRRGPDVLPELLVFQHRIARETKRSARSLAENLGLGRTAVEAGFIRELEGRARELGISKVGYCRIPPRFVFRDHRIMFENAIVCTQEMKRSEIETAPMEQAGLESMRVYASLGTAVNRLVDWMRERGVPAQGSHPLGGFTLYPALAAEAGLGYAGRSGMLITPEFGIRQRIAAIYTPVENLPFSPANEHRWVLDFCDRCNKCVRSCPGGAVLPEARENVPGVFTSTDYVKCFPWFALKSGCSICVKVCPFSRGSYDRIKRAHERGSTDGPEKKCDR